MAFNWRPLMGRIAAFRQELGENLTGIYLHGSAAFGSMSEGSDLDFIAVTERPPTQEQKEHLIAALLQLEREAPAKGLEMSVVLLRDCRDFAYPTPYQLHYSPMHRRAFEQDLAGYCRRMQGVDCDLAAHFTVIRRVGIVLFGSPIREVFGPVPFCGLSRQHLPGRRRRRTGHPAHAAGHRPQSLPGAGRGAGGAGALQGAGGTVGAAAFAKAVPPLSDAGSELL